MEKLSQTELDALLSGPEAVTLLDLDLRGLVFPEYLVDLQMVRCCAEHLDFTGRNFGEKFHAEDCNFYGSDFVNANFSDAAFIRCNLSASAWTGATAESLEFEGCDTFGATMPGPEATGGGQDGEETTHHAGAPDTPAPSVPDTLPSETEGQPS